MKKITHLIFTVTCVIFSNIVFAEDTVRLYWAPNDPGPGPGRQYYESPAEVCSLFAGNRGFTFCGMESELSCIVGTINCDESDPQNGILKPGVGLGLDAFGLLLESNNNNNT